MCNYIAGKKTKTGVILLKLQTLRQFFFFYKLVTVLNFGLNIVYEFHIIVEKL